MIRSVRAAVRVMCAAGGAGIVVIALVWLLRTDLPVWLGALIWSLAVLAAVGTTGQVAEKLTREPTRLPTGEVPEQVEIGKVGQQRIHVVKVLRKHAVIEKPHELPREGFPIVVAVDPGEIDVVTRKLTELGVAVRRVGSGPSSRD